ncbi:Xaa-Pro peptidase family protein [Humibacter sp. RRB41]|uniref:M24 family metallopeptidase n=1 Tax=Humibacter sp. RRB41 TaxID=2919946 RepID=UPI001FAAF973|nr:M24 family metallopeptidase [Humibacter sp. RRB41]
MSDGGAPPARPQDDRAVKRGRVLALLEEADAASVLLTSATAVAWYLDGGRQYVSLAADPIVTLRVSHDGDEAFVTSNETARLVAEELPAGITVRERPWYEPLQASHEPGVLLERDLDPQLRAARAVLLPGELTRFRALSEDAAHAVTDVLLEADPTWSERRGAAELAARLVSVGADPLVLLVAGESRASLPHPLPTDAPLGRRAMVVVCARRDGLIANLSRWVSFGPQTEPEQDAQRRILQVEAAAFDATRPGTPLNDVLATIAAAYPANGFPADQWTRHHQGGAAGYNGRDPRATPTTDDIVRLGQAFTWNPWVPGAKVEDTVLLAGSADAPVIETITVDERWPTERVEGRDRPVALER